MGIGSPTIGLQEGFFVELEAAFLFGINNLTKENFS
jgi:hypothetical protein